MTTLETVAEAIQLADNQFRKENGPASDYSRRSYEAMARAAINAAASHPPYQRRVHDFMVACFSMESCRDSAERNHRFLEEAIELVQARGCTSSEAHQLVDYVFGRPVGEPSQEVGGVMVTLAALCLAGDIDMAAAGEAELARVWTKIETIRAKQAAKPKFSPLPSSNQVNDLLSDVAKLTRHDGQPTILAERASEILNGGAA